MTIDSPEAERPAPSRRVGFYAEPRFYEAILDPVRAALAGRVETLLGADREALVAFRPHVLVLSAPRDLAWFRRRLPDTRMGLISHGMLRKGRVRRLAGRADGPAARFDFIAVGDDTVADIYRQSGTEPKEFWYTGFPLMDRLFRGDPPPALPLDPAQPTVLFAPTWNLGLSGAPFLGDRVVDLIRGDGPPLNVIIKPHPNIARFRPRWMRWWRRLAEADRRVYLVPDVDADVTTYMLAADVMVSDASSVIVEYLALDRPIVLVTNPDHGLDPEYDPQDICWRWRDVGTEVLDPERLAGAVARALADPGERSDRRQEYAARLFGEHRDGRNAERIAERIVGLAGDLPEEVGVQAGRARSRRGWRTTLGDLRQRVLMNPRYVDRLRAGRETIRLWVSRRRSARGGAGRTA